MSFREILFLLALIGIGSSIVIVLRATPTAVDFAGRVAEPALPPVTLGVGDQYVPPVPDLPVSRDGATGEISFAGRVYKITFPDGAVFSAPRRAQLRDLVSEPFFYDNVAAAYTRLRQAAESGDAASSLLLGSLLQSCRHSPRDQHMLETQIYDAYQTYSLPQSSGPAVVLDGSVDLTRVESSLRDSFERCKGVTDEQLDEGDFWVELAAELGNDFARDQRAYRSVGSSGGFELLLERWHAGTPDVLSIISRYYRGTYGDDEVKPNRVTAYAYNFLAIQFTLANFASPDRVPEQWRNAALGELKAQGDALSPRELEDALKLAKTLLAENNNCCFDRR